MDYQKQQRRIRLLIVAGLVILIMSVGIIIAGNGSRLFGTSGETPTDAPPPPPTDVPPTAVPPTAVPPTEVPPTGISDFPTSTITRRPATRIIDYAATREAATTQSFVASITAIVGQIRATQTALAWTKTPTYTRTQQPITSTYTPLPFTPNVPATQTAAAFKTADASNLTPLATQVTPSTKVAENPNITDPDDLGMANARVRAPHSMGVMEVALIKLDIGVPPLRETPTYIPSREPTSTLAPNEVLLPTSTELPLVLSVDVPARTFMKARLGGRDIANFEIVMQEPPPEELGKRVLLRGQTAWWEWNIRVKEPSLVGEKQLQIIISYERLENGQIHEVTQPPLTFKIMVNPPPATLTSEPTELPTSTPNKPLIRDNPSQFETSLWWIVIVIGVVIVSGVLIIVIVRTRRTTTRAIAGGQVMNTPPLTSTALDQVLCFISYARKDEEFTIKLSQRLRDEGISIWRDRDDISAGTSWDDEIDKALKRSTHVLFVASISSCASKNVLDELNAALNYDKFVLPILLDNCQLPFRIRRNQWVDFRGDFEAAIAKLLKDLGKGAR